MAKKGNYSREGSRVVSVRLTEQMMGRIDDVAARLKEDTGMTVDRSDAIRWLLTKSLEYEGLRDFPDVHDGQFALANLAYGIHPSAPDDPHRRYIVVQKNLWDKGFFFILTLGDSTRKIADDIGTVPDQAWTERAMKNAIGRVTRRWKSKDREDRLQNMPTGKRNAISVKVLDSDFLIGIGRSFSDLRKDR